MSEELRDWSKPLKIGEMAFELGSVKKLDPRISKSCTLTARTPIIVRVPKRMYRHYGIKPPKNYGYIYWRRPYPLEAFVKQLEDNLYKKYKAFHKSDISEIHPLFERFELKKAVCNHIVIKRRETKVFGSLWRFDFLHLEELKRKILQFGLAAGFGERVHWALDS